MTHAQLRRRARELRCERTLSQYLERCDPPESFVLGSVLAHVLTYSAHRRELARHLLGRRPGEGDPILWLRHRLEEDD